MFLAFASAMLTDMNASRAIRNVLLVFLVAPCVNAQTYSQGGHNTNSCNSPSAAVTSASECQTYAVPGLGPGTHQWCGSVDHNDRPSGCIYQEYMSSPKCVYFNSNTANSLKNNFGMVCRTGASPMATGGDPIFYYGGHKIKFELTPGLLMPLLRTPSLTILGSTFAGNSWEQWFGHFLVTDSQDTRSRIVDVKIKKSFANFNGTHTSNRGKALRTIQVMAGKDKHPIHQEGHVTFSGRDGLIQVGCWRMTPDARILQSRMGKAHRECVIVRSSDTHFAFCSSPASEYFGPQHHLSTANAHLDLVIVELFNPAYLTGILPELWRRAEAASRHNDTESVTSPHHDILGLLSQDQQSEQVEEMVENLVDASRKSVLEFI